MSVPCAHVHTTCTCTHGSSTVALELAVPWMVLGMDARERLVVWTALSQMPNTAIIVGTESLEECSAFSTRMCVLSEGRVEAIGPVESLLRRCVPGTLMPPPPHTHRPRAGRTTFEWNAGDCWTGCH